MVELDLTQADIAMEMGVAPNTISRHLSSDKPSGFSFMAGLAKVLETSIEDLTLPASDDGPEAA